MVLKARRNLLRGPDRQLFDRVIVPILKPTNRGLPKRVSKRDLEGLINRSLKELDSRERDILENPPSYYQEEKGFTPEDHLDYVYKFRRKLLSKKQELEGKNR